MAYRRLKLDDGWVEYLSSGPEDASGLLLLHVGSPAAAVNNPGLARAAAEAGLRLACYSRGGYGSSPRREGRTVADEARISAALADHLGFERFFTAGWSGGGPVALACAAMIPDRVLACAAIASPAPPVEVGAAWSTFWRPEQYADWQELLAADAEALRSDFEAAALMFGEMTLPRLRARADLDRLDTRGRDHHIETEVHPVLVRSMRRSVSRGYAGYMDDNLAQARDWGFRVADIRVPVVVRHGTLDRLVPVAHGRWLASAIPGARGVFLDDAGHGSVVLPFQELIAQLVSAAG